jgi:PAS domain-containing protein
MPTVIVLWLVAPLVFLGLALAYARRRASKRRDLLDAARVRGRTSDAGLTTAMTEALTRLRGQELAHQARHEALEGFFQQVVESLPLGMFVLGRDGNLRVANAEALRWLGLQGAAQGQVLWTLDGTEPLRVVAQSCLEEAVRRDASLVGPGAKGAPVPVTALPLRASEGSVDGVLYLVHVERVA